VITQLLLLNLWIRNGSHIATHLIVLIFICLLVGATTSNKAEGSFISNGIGMKFSQID